MYLQNTKGYADLIQHMRDDGYSVSHISKMNTEVNWLQKNAEKEKIQTHEDAYRIRECCTKSNNMRKQYRMIYGIFMRFDLYNEYPDRRQNEPLIKRAGYHQLNTSFKAIIDAFKETCGIRGFKKSSIRTHISCCSCFLLAMQNKGHSTLEDITEEDTMSFFTRDNNIAILNYGYKKSIETVLKASIGTCAKSITRILAYLPTIHSKRKNIQYLKPKEIDSIHEALGNMSNALSFRNRAIGWLLFFTGIRSCDIAQMKLSNIDWAKDEIRLIQQKTGGELVLILTATIGNAIYDYITCERPKSIDKHLFLSEVKPYYPLTPAAISQTSSKVYEAAAVRQNSGDRRGGHLFRHNLATSLSGKGIPRPVISNILGQADPDALDRYLSADLTHLRECALSIESFPVNEEVFNI